MDTYKSQMSITGMEQGKSYSELLEYEYRLTDGGRSSSKRSKQTGDCTVIALATVAGITYDEAYDYLRSKYNRKSGQGCFFPKKRSDDQAMGLRFKWQSFPAKKGKRRMNPAQFCQDYSKGVYIVKTAKHVVAVIDGIVHNEYEIRPNRCIYGAWEVY